MFSFFSSNKKDKAAAAKSIKKKSGAKKIPPAASRKFAAVKIVSVESRPCLEVKRLFSEVYLCNEAPLVPLQNCTNKENCGCRYKHLADRRTTARRVTDNGLPDKHLGKDRRKKIDRRVH